MMTKEGWKQVKFGEVVKLNRDRVEDPVAEGIERYVGIEHIEPEDLRIRSWGLVAEGTTFTNYFRPGQVLFVKRRAYQRKVAVADFAGVCSGDIYVLEPKDPQVLLPELLPFICQTDGFFNHAVGTSAGSLSPRTNWTQLANYEFALPPLEEQRRIAEILTRIEDLLESIQSLEQSTDRLTEAIVEDFFSSIQDVEQIQLNEIADVRYGLTVNKSRRTASKKFPYLRVANVMRGQIDLSEVKEIGFTSGDEIYELKADDVLIVEGHANSEEIGRAALWKGEIEKCLHQNHLIRVRCQSFLEPEFLVTYLNSVSGRKYFLAHSKSTSGLNTINSTVVREVSVPEISPENQREFVKTLNQMEQQKSKINQRYGFLLSIKRAVLDGLG